MSSLRELDEAPRKFLFFGFFNVVSWQCLVGPVLAGTASPHNEIELHLFADTPEAVVFQLMEHGVRHRVAERRVRLMRDEPRSFPSVQFASGRYDVDAVVFPRDGIRQAPFSPVDGKPMRRATRAEVEALVAG